MFLKRLSSVLLMLLITTIAACLLYPWVQQAVAAWTDWDYPPARVFRRIWMLAVFAGLLIGRKPLGLLSPARAGFSFNKTALPNLGVGLAAVFLFLFGLSCFYLLIGAWNIPETLPIEKLRKRFFEGLLRGILVSGLEEYIFRGLIFFSLCRSWPWKRSAVITSLIFASLHFLEGRGHEAIANPTAWSAGFQICGMLVSNMAHEFTFFPDAVGLFIVGMALCHAAHRTGSLWYGAALHGGWVWYFSFRSSLLFNAQTVDALWIGGSRLFNGVIPMLGMLLIFPATQWMAHKGILRETPRQNSE
ncbi:MAG: CPBP family intramembrane metalloprotease [Candidatus Omnitrophica bacterium]|nr:CPBP family intramembrane metalloprotease [Candidatus Omnitrophota bacterium]